MSSIAIIVLMYMIWMKTQQVGGLEGCSPYIQKALKKVPTAEAKEMRQKANQEFIEIMHTRTDKDSMLNTKVRAHWLALCSLSRSLVGPVQ